MEWISITLIVLSVLYYIKISIDKKSSANTPLKFFQGGEELNKRSFFATLAASSTGLGACVYLIIIYGYFYGLGVFPWVLGFFMLTQMASVYTIKKVSIVYPEFISKNGTLHEFLGMLFNSRSVRSIAGFMSTITYSGLIAVELLLGYEVLRALIPGTKEIFSFEMGPLLFLFAIAVAVFYYTSKGGFKVVVATDKIQLGLIILLMAVVMGIVGLNFTSFFTSYTEHYPSLSNIKESVFNASGQGMISFMFYFVFMNLIFWAMWWPSAMDQWHRIAATRSTESALDVKFGVFSISSVMYFASLTISFLLLGVLVKTAISPDDPTQPLYYFLTGIISGVSESGKLFQLLGIGAVSLGLISIMISTLDTYIVVATQSFVSDVIFTKKYGKTLHHIDKSLTNSEKKNALKLSQKTVLLLCIPVLILFFLIFQLADVFSSIYLFYSFMMALIPAIFIGLLGKHKEKNANAISYSLIGGGIWALVTNVYLMLKINTLILGSKYVEVQFYYNLLYANPTTTAIISFIIYLVFRKK